MTKSIETMTQELKIHFPGKLVFGKGSCERGKDDAETAAKGVQKIKDLIRECGIPTRLRDVNIPKEINREDAIAIYTAAY